VAHAEADSRRIRHEAEDYIDQKLAAFEVVLDRTMQAVVRGREQLQAVVAPLTEVGGEPVAGDDDFDDRVFDQDDA